jgi:hypothetical protein
VSASSLRRRLPVPARPDAFVLNVARLFSRWTNNHWKVPFVNG